MNIKNTPNNYGSIAKWIHWITALLFLTSYATIYYRRWFTEEKTPENWNVIQLHFAIGITLGVLVVLRIIWRMSNTNPKPEPGSKMEHLAAHLGHYALYAVMIIMPITGYFGTGAATDYFSMFEIPKFEDTAMFSYFVNDLLGMTFKEFESPMDFIHKDIFGKWVLWMLIVGHAAAAMYHHFIKKDRTFKKMTIDKNNDEINS
jgi:cytochrome b561